MNTKGDIGNFTADANGNGTITLTTDEWNIGSGDPTKRYSRKRTDCT
jgi:Cu-Zn family superoxide dismutase